MKARTIDIVPYSMDWPQEFQALASPIRQAMDSLARRIDHIGSTAVPGLAAKDIIDIQVSVASLESAQRLIDALARVGYTVREDIRHDHVPPGISEDDPRDWTKLYFTAPAGQRPTHLHVRVDGRANQRYALLFRDYLRAHPPAAAAYGEIKRQLARHLQDDWDAYYDIKDPVCDIVMQGANNWAAAEGWHPGPTDA